MTWNHIQFSGTDRKFAFFFKKTGRKKIENNLVHLSPNHPFHLFGGPLVDPFCPFFSAYDIVCTPSHQTATPMSPVLYAFRATSGRWGATIGAEQYAPNMHLRPSSTIAYGLCSRNRPHVVAAQAKPTQRVISRVKSTPACWIKKSSWNFFFENFHKADDLTWSSSW